MKKLLPGIAVFMFVALFGFKSDPNPLLGRWSHTRKDGNETYKFLYIFRADSTVDLVINGKAFVTGKYILHGDTARVSDPSCNSAYWSTYHLGFYGTDSVLITAVSDTCAGRKEGMSGVTLVKVKPAKK